MPCGEKSWYMLKGAVMEIEKVQINERLRLSKIS